jgi:hypothetical protein
MTLGPALRATAYYFIKQVLFGGTHKAGGLHQPMAMHRHDKNPWSIEGRRRIDSAAFIEKGTVTWHDLVSDSVQVHDAAVQTRKMAEKISERLFSLATTQFRGRAISLYNLLIPLKEHDQPKLTAFGKFTLHQTINLGLKDDDGLLAEFYDFMQAHMQELNSLGVLVDEKRHQARFVPPDNGFEPSRVSIPPPAVAQSVEETIAGILCQLMDLAFTQERYLFMGIYDQLFTIKALSEGQCRPAFDKFVQRNREILNHFGLLDA